MSKEFRNGSWVLQGLLGWLAGIVCGIAVGSVFEALQMKILGQSALGLGVGFGVAYFQWRYLRHRCTLGAQWISLTGLSFLCSFVLCDLVNYAAGLRPETTVPFAVVAGALLAAYAQLRFVPGFSEVPRAEWMIRSALGWGLSYLLTLGGYVVDIKNIGLPRVVVLIYAFGVLFVGGPVLALILAPPLRKLCSHAGDNAFSEESK